MKILNRTASFLSCLGLSAGLLLSPLVSAESDKEIQEKALKAREVGRMHDMDHGAMSAAENAAPFRGVFYGYLPCNEKDCDGVKMTLSLNGQNRYLLVIQPAKALNRESFEKGRYEWDDKERTLVLNPYKEGTAQRRLTIQDAGTLLYLTQDGSHLTKDQDRYLLKRTDVSNNREMHIH